MQAFLQFLNLAMLFATKPETLALLKQLREWFGGLTPAEQMAYAAKFEPFRGYGCSGVDDCPDCPPECREVEQTMLGAVAEVA